MGERENAMKVMKTLPHTQAVPPTTMVMYNEGDVCTLVLCHNRRYFSKIYDGT